MKACFLFLSLLLISCADSNPVDPVAAEPLSKSVGDELTLSTITFFNNERSIGKIRSGYIPELGYKVTLEGQFRFTETPMINAHKLRLSDLSDGEELRAEIDSLKQIISELKSLIKNRHSLLIQK